MVMADPNTNACNQHNHTHTHFSTHLCAWTAPPQMPPRRLPALLASSWSHVQHPLHHSICSKTAHTYTYACRCLKVMVTRPTPFAPLHLQQDSKYIHVRVRVLESYQVHVWKHPHTQPCKHTHTHTYTNTRTHKHTRMHIHMPVKRRGCAAQQNAHPCSIHKYDDTCFETRLPVIG
jgi:hypothetical protein